MGAAAVALTGCQFPAAPAPVHLAGVWASESHCLPGTPGLTLVSPAGVLGHSSCSARIPSRVGLLRVWNVTQEAYSLWLVTGMGVSVSCRQPPARAMRM